MFTPFSFIQGFESDFDTDYQAILTYAGTQGYSNPSALQQIYQNQLVRDLKAAGIWGAMDFLYIFATDGSTGFAKINWVNPGTYEATEYTSVAFTNNVGFQANGTNALDTNYIPATDWAGGSDVSMGGWFDLDGNTDGCAMGSFQNTRTQIIPRLVGSGGQARYGISLNPVTNPTTVSTPTTDGLWVTDNDGSGSTRLFTNNSQVFTSSDGGGSSFSDAEISLLARKTGPNNTDRDKFTTHKVSMAFFGERTAGQNIYGPITTYLNKL